MKRLTKFAFLLVFAAVMGWGCKVNNTSVTRKPVEYENYVVLNEDDDFKNTVTQPNTIYVIKYKYDLKGKKITVPENCELSFEENGEISNGSIVFSNTNLSGAPKFTNIGVSGAIYNPKVYLKWFDFTLDAKEEKSSGKNSALLMQLAPCVEGQLYLNKYYPLAEPIVLKDDITFISEDWSEDNHSVTYEYSYVPKNGFYSVKANTLFELQNKANLSLYGIKLTGMEGSECAVDGGWGNSVDVVYNCIIEKVKYGITIYGGYIEKIQNTTFDYCDYGIFVVYTSDFDVFGCRFTNCGLEYQDILSSMPAKITGNHIAGLKATSAAVFAASTGMLDFNSNYFENNLISVMLSDDDIIFNLQKNYFKNPVLCDVFTLSCKNYIEPMIAPKYNPAIDCVTITDNIFEKSGSGRSLLDCVMFIREADNRGTNLVFSKNTVKDSRTSVSEEDCIFLISNASDGCGNLVCNNNDFSASKAKALTLKLPVYTQSGSLEKEGNFSVISSEK